MSFDRVAPFYCTLERLVFGDQLQLARLAFVNEIGTPRRVLIVGEGDGRFLVEFVERFPEAEIDCVEASGRMIALARSRLGAEHEVNFIQADVRELSLERNHYDLIVTHFFLDCFAGTDLRDVVQRLAKAGSSNAIWLLADFRVPEERRQRLQARFLIRAMFLFFGLTSGLAIRRLDDPSLLLRTVGFERIRQRLARRGVIKSELWRGSA